jgi:MscS family membrane protein
MSRFSAKQFSSVLLRFCAGLLACFALTRPAHAQRIVSSPASATPAASSTAPLDALRLGRETPHGTLVGFIRAAQSENYEDATKYFQYSDARHRPTAAQAKELAAQTLAVLNTGFSGSLDAVPDVAQLSHDQVTLGLHINGELVPFQVVRTDDHGTKVWLISWETLEQVPEVYDSLRFPQVEKQLPRFLVKMRPLEMPIWQWIAVVLSVPLALALGWLVALLTWTVRQWIRRARGLAPLPTRDRRRFGPGTLLIATIIHYNFVNLIGTSLLYRLYYRRFVLVLLGIALYWAVTRITYWISCIIWNDLTERNLIAERSLISLGRRALDVGIFVTIGLFVLTNLDVNVSAALAGLGIGGLAIGFGAQKTFENLLGGISILTDKAIMVGDPCKIGDQRGTVEDIGLRSTKLRTEERTLVSIPNGTVATATLENFRWRDKILCRQTVRLRYDLSADHLRFVLEQLREILEHHPKVDSEGARVRVLKLGEYAIEMEIYAYIMVPTYAEYLSVQEELILLVMDTLERTGAAVALSSQSMVISGDQWVDPKTSAAARSPLDRSEGAGVSPRQGSELSPGIVPRKG